MVLRCPLSISHTLPSHGLQHRGRLSTHVLKDTDTNWGVGERALARFPPLHCSNFLTSCVRRATGDLDALPCHEDHALLHQRTNGVYRYSAEDQWAIPVTDRLDTLGALGKRSNQKKPELLAAIESLHRLSRGIASHDRPLTLSYYQSS